MSAHEEPAYPVELMSCYYCDRSVVIGFTNVLVHEDVVTGEQYLECRDQAGVPTGRRAREGRVMVIDMYDRPTVFPDPLKPRVRHRAQQR